MAAALERLRSEQIRLLYRSGPIGVVAAMMGAFVLAALIWYLDPAALHAIIIWLCVVVADVVLHLLLAWRYARSANAMARWRLWALGFCGFSLVEGLIWGVTSVSLASPHQFNEQLLIMDVVCAVTTGAVSAFGAYLPAFFVLFLPATLPFAVVSAMQGGFFGSMVTVLVLVFIVGILFVAYRHNGDLREMIRLRFENLDLAAELRVQKEAAEAASLAKTRFLAAASHDLRQPVHALSLFVGALRGHALDAEPARLVDLIEDSVNAMDGLFSALLDISRLDAGIVAPDWKVFQVQELFDRLMRDYAADAAEKSLSLRIRPCAAWIRSDPVLLERILRNLLSNAIRYTDSGGVLIGCRHGRALRVQVWDTGRGIPAAQAERVFEEFFQLQNPERDRAQGLGLGLAIVRRLAALLNHGITLSSQPGRGSVFSIKVPLAPSVATPHSVAKAAGARQGLIFVVDDEAAVQEGMRSLLTGWGHHVLAAGSGDDMMACAAACLQRPDVIVCDYRLRGGETGVEVIERLRAEYNHDIPALLITGDTAPDRLTEAARSGLLLLHKPVANGRLRAAVNNLLRAENDKAGVT
jgi:signal transduction histidine kinase/CheY-like chemotaxis protein